MAKQATAEIVEAVSEETPAFVPLTAKGDSAQQRVLWMAMFTPGLEGRRGLPYVLVGEPGTAKTSVVKLQARRAGLPFEAVLGSLRSPVDYLGIPVPQRRKLGVHDQHLSPDGDEEMLYMHYAPAGFAVRAALRKRCVILHDEANTMPPAVQAAMLRALFEGVVGELEWPSGVRQFLAMNRIGDAAGGWEIAPALANRMGWLDWEGVTPEQFSEYLISSQGRGSGAVPVDSIDPELEEAEMDARWGNAWAQASGQVTGFLTARSALFHKKPSKGADRAWPSARTWDFAAHALAGSLCYQLNEREQGLAIGAYIGDGTYAEFFTWSKSADLPDPAKLLDGNAAFEHNSARLDRTAAVLSGCTALVVPDSADKRTIRANALWRLIERLTGGKGDAVDVCLPAVASLCRSRLMIGDNTAYKVLAKLEPVLDISGLTHVS
jgi:hypothetical protein